MKKILSLVLALFLGTIAASALNIEVDGMYYFTFQKFSRTKWEGIEIHKDLQQKLEYVAPVGIGANATLYFANAGIAEFGVNLAAGFDIGTLQNRLPNNDKTGDAIWGGGGFIKIGFAMNFNFDSINSLYISPGVIIGGATVAQTIPIINETTRFSTVVVGLDIDLGYRAWFLHQSDFIFGIDVGINIDAPLGVSTSQTIKLPGTKTNTSGRILGGGFKLYIGPCFKFGV
ncbi:MAG: hypothetical protein IJR49_01560 [Treponema sp.]|nr:hypothetical protein [Treponema sp.]